MPQPKKHSSTRARRNKASTAATLSVVETPDYSDMTIAELRAEIERRNEDCEPGTELKMPARKDAMIRVLVADDEALVPDLPERALGWLSMTRTWWRDVWTSPMSDEWHAETDLHNVLAAAMHYDDMWRAETPAERQKADVAFQKREAALGLTPYDRRRLEWSIENVKSAQEERRRRSGTGKSPKSSQPSKPTASDPRAAFAVVN